MNKEPGYKETLKMLREHQIKSSDYLDERGHLTIEGKTKSLASIGSSHYSPAKKTLVSKCISTEEKGTVIDSPRVMRNNLNISSKDQMNSINNLVLNTHHNQ
jgi:hypothetical protein